MIKKHKLAFIILLLVIVGGLLLYRGNGPLKRLFNKSDKPTASTSTTAAIYVSFDGKYYFIVPELYTVDGHSLPGYPLIYKNDQTYEPGSSLAALYDKGVIAVQPISGASKIEDIKKFVDATLKPDTEKTLGAKTDAQYDKIDKRDRVTITSIKDGKTIRVQRIVAGDHTALVVASAITPQFDQISKTQDISALPSKVSDDIHSAEAIITTLLDNLKQGKNSKITDNGSIRFHEQTKPADLDNALKASQKVIARTVNVSGATYRPDILQAIIYFSDPNSKATPNLPGLITLAKEDGKWKVDSISIPDDTTIK